MKNYIYVFGLLLLPVMAEAQNNFLGLSWNISIPTASSTSFVDETSIRGGQFEFRDFIQSNLSVGLSLGWNAYQEYTPRQTYPIENGAVTTDLTKYTYTLPILFNVHYYYPVSEYVMPYISAGMGGMYSEREIFFNVYGIAEYKWGFAFRPELGVVFPFGEGFGAILAADYLMATNDSDELNINSTSSFNFRVGFLLIR
ncbi:outer membrane beta-barrel protein [Catalinimonas sp. 4WD22]|uniref:outer membrane beta-barrel protein n=1 Tax=Catalinimonas locisalis TaxID=3133978 RepID=UPI003101796D